MAKKYLTDNLGRRSYYDPITKEFQPESWISYINRRIANLLMFFGLFTVVLMVSLGFTGFANVFGSAILQYDARAHSTEIRSFVLEHTEYEGDDFFEYAKELLVALPDIRYVPNDLNKLWEEPMDCLEKGGDCKSMSVMFVSMMRSVGAPAFVDCEAFIAQHCVARIPYPDANQYMIVDLAKNTNQYSIFWEYIDHWSEPENYYERGYVNEIINDKEKEFVHVIPQKWIKDEESELWILQEQ